jgi:hypothetical protein
MNYAASTFLCIPSSLSQPVGLSLGAQAGESPLYAVLTEAGYHHIRRLTTGRYPFRAGVTVASWTRPRYPA